MRVFSVEQAAELLKVPDLASFFGDVDWQYRDPVPALFLPADAGKRVALAHAVGNTFLDRGTVLVWITETGIFTQHMDLFDGYRRSFGELRSVYDAPVHLFEETDRDTIISILCIGLIFFWDFEVMNLDRSFAMTFSHDEWMEYRFAPGHEDVIRFFDQHFGYLEWSPGSGKPESTTT